MPNVNVSFLGNTLVLPNAYYADNVSAALQPVQSLTPPLIFIGNFYGLQPLTPTTYTLATDASAAMRGSPATQYLQFMVNPAPALQGAQYITLINAAQNTQSSLTLQNSAAANEIVLTSANYGSPSNLLQAEVQAGTTDGLMVTLYDGFTNTSVTGDNLGAPFQIAYTGSASGVTFTVSGTAAGATNLILHSSNAAESFNIALGGAGYATVGQIVAYLNGTSSYVSTVQSNANLPSSSLALASTVPLSVPTAGVYNYVTVPAYNGDIIFWVNQYAGGFATAALASGATLTSGAVPVTIPLTHFAGATNVPPTNSNYASAFNVALNTPGWAVFADSNAAAVMALGAQHAQTASTPLYGKWRRFVTGSNVGDSVAVTAQNAQQLNSITTTYCYPGIYRTDTVSGVNTLFGGLAVAAAVAGIMCGNILAQPLTNQQLTGNGIEQAGGGGTFLSTSQINILQQSGVLVVNYPTANVPTIVSDLTVWQGDNNPENVFNQQVSCRWGLAYSLTSAVQPYIGTIASPYGITRIRNAVITTLNNLKYSPGNNGILVSWDPSTLVLKYTGATQSLAISVNVVLVGQIRFILEQTFVQPLNLSTSSATSQISATA